MKDISSTSACTISSCLYFLEHYSPDWTSPTIYLTDKKQNTYLISIFGWRWDQFNKDESEEKGAAGRELPVNSSCHPVSLLTIEQVLVLLARDGALPGLRWHHLLRMSMLLLFMLHAVFLIWQPPRLSPRIHPESRPRNVLLSLFYFRFVTQSNSMIYWLMTDDETRWHFTFFPWDRFST